MSDATNFIKPRRVFITNMGYHNYEPAKKYGQLVPITRGEFDYRKTDRLMGKIHLALEDMTPDDYICMSGPNLAVGLVFAYVLNRFGIVHYLYWEPLLQDYLYRKTDGTLTKINSDLENDIPEEVINES